MKKLSMVSFAVGLLLAGSALALPVIPSGTVFSIDDFTAAQSVVANLATPNASNTQSAPVAGVNSWFGDRTLSAILTGGGGKVEADIGSGNFACSRSFSAVGICAAGYKATSNFTIGELSFGAVNDGAFSGTAAVEFYKNAVLIISQSISAGSGLYSVVLNTDWLIGDFLWVIPVGSVAVDQAIMALEGTNKVPEPGSLALAGIGLLGLAVARRRVGAS
jgi:hypothetical protein